MAEPKRVCITGLGAVSPFGRSPADLWRGLLAGRSAVASIESFDASDLSCRIAAEVRDYAPREDMAPDAAVGARTISAAGPASHLANAAASSLMAIGEAAEWIRRDECSIAVAGGAAEAWGPRGGGALGDTGPHA